MARTKTEGFGAFQRAIEKNNLSPLCLLESGEQYYTDQAVKMLEDTVVGSDLRDFNYQKFQAGEANPEDIIAAASTLPMMASRRLIIVKGFEKYSAGELERMLPYVKDPVPSTVLVFLAQKVDSRLKFFQEFKKRGQIYQFAAPYANELPQWVMNEARDSKVQIDPMAASLIVEVIGTDLLLLKGAIDKLALYCHDTGIVTVREVETLITYTRVESIFDLTDAIGYRNLEKAMAILQRMLMNREPPLRIVAMINRHLRQIWMAKELQAERADSDTIAKEVGISPYFVKKLLGQAEKFPSALIERGLHQLFKADDALKSSYLNDEIILTELILQLTQNAP